MTPSTSTLHKVPLNERRQTLKTGFVITIRQQSPKFLPYSSEKRRTRHFGAVLLIISLKEVCLFHKMGVRDGALQRDAHQTWRALSFTAAFHGALEQSKSHQQTSLIKVPPPFMLQRKKHTDVLSCLRFSYHVSVNLIK